MPEMIINPLDEDAVLKEVWNTLEIDAKTELSSEQIERVNKLKFMSVIFGNSALDKHLTSFMVLQKSKNRQSMGEFVSVVKAKREDFVNKGKSWLGGMMG